MSLLADPDTPAIHLICTGCGEAERHDRPFLFPVLSALLDNGYLKCNGCGLPGTLQQVFLRDVESSKAEFARHSKPKPLT